MGKTIDVFVYGEIVIDNIIRVAYMPTPSRTADVLSESFHLGGVGANGAIFLASWGLNVRLTGNALGNDGNGRQVMEWLKEDPNYPIDLEYMETRSDLHTPYCRIMITPDGKRCLLFGGRDRKMVPLQPEMLDGATLLALDLYGGETCDEAARVAHQAGLKIVVSDIAWTDHPVLPLAHVITNSAGMLRREYPGKDLVQHALELHQVSQSIIITTDGPSAVHVVDTTGAGDAFKSGVIYSLWKGWNLKKAVCWGVTAGSLNTTRIGAVSQPPTLSEIEGLVDTIKVRTA